MVQQISHTWSLVTYIKVLPFVAFWSMSALAQMDFDVLTEWKYLPDQSNALYERFLDEAESHRFARNERVAATLTAEQWLLRQEWVRDKLQDLIGPFPKKSPLKPHITGVINHDKYTIEKLHFQSIPEFFVTAALFIPKNVELPAPAILFCSGHSREGFRSPTYQHMILNYVQKGFVVFAFDPIGQGERSQYLDAQGKAIFGPTHDHSFAGNQVFLNGISPANYFIWDGIRALDYLESRPEVDHSRIGVTGRSGGGTQTSYIMAVDERVAVAAPECYLTTFDKLLRSRGPQDAEQNILYFLDGLDLADLVEVRAPKPTLLVTTTRDIFSIAGARTLFHEAQNAYEAFSAKESLMMVEDDAPHASTKRNREATYAFFQRHLDHPGDSEDEVVDTLDKEDLWVTSSGQIIRDLASKTIFDLNTILGESLRNQREAVVKPSFFDQLPSKLGALINIDTSVQVDETIYAGRDDFSSYSIEKFLLAHSAKFYLPVVRLQPDKTSGKLVLLLDSEGKSNQNDPSSLALRLVREGHQVFLADLSGIGELGGGYIGGDANIDGVPINQWYAGVLTNKSAVAIRSEEITMLVDFIKDLSNDQSVHLVSIGTMGVDVLHALTLGVSLSSLTLVDHLVSYQSIIQTKNYQPKYILSSVAGSNTLYDLPQLSHFAPEKMQLINVVDAAGDPAADEELERYQDYRSVAPKVEMGVAPEAVKDKVSQYLNSF